jgi:hypothetical protein
VKISIISKNMRVTTNIVTEDILAELRTTHNWNRFLYVYGYSDIRGNEPHKEESYPLLWSEFAAFVYILFQNLWFYQVSILQIASVTSKNNVLFHPLVSKGLSLCVCVCALDRVLCSFILCSREYLPF